MTTQTFPNHRSRHDLIAEVLDTEAALEEALAMARWRRREIVNALTIREVDNIPAFKLAVHEKQLNKLYQWR